MRALTDAEIARFLTVTHVASGDGRTEQRKRLFCRLLLYTGCLLTEGLHVERRHIDLRAQTIAIPTLKKRKAEPPVRMLAMPRAWIEEIAIVADLVNKKAVADERLWPMGRTTAWRVVKDAMDRAKIDGAIATPMGLRHSFALRQLQRGSRLNEVRDSLGNSSYDSMLRYVEVLGGGLVPQERT